MAACLLFGLPGAGTANCGMVSGNAYSTGSPGDPAIVSAYFGRVTGSTGPRSVPTYTVAVGRHVAGTPIAREQIRFSGRATCAWLRLNVGQLYLFATTRTDSHADDSLVFEIYGPAWRSIIWGAIQPVTLDGAEVPTDPGRLQAFLRRTIPSLPLTNAGDVSGPPTLVLWPVLLFAGTAAAAAWLLRTHR